MYITSPSKFAALFNEKFPDAPRMITTEDVINMTRCKMICRHDFYSRDDLEAVRGALEYEQMRDKISKQDSTDDKLEQQKCKMCGQPLPIEHENKIERPKEYCPECESLRNRERQ